MSLERVDTMDVLLFHAEALADFAEHAKRVGILTASHAGGAVVENQHRNRSVLVDAV